MTFLKKGAGVEIKHHITYSREEIEFEWPLKRKWKSHGLGINKNNNLGHQASIGKASVTSIHMFVHPNVALAHPNVKSQQIEGSLHFPSPLLHKLLSK